MTKENMQLVPNYFPFPLIVNKSSDTHKKFRNQIIECDVKCFAFEAALNSNPLAGINPDFSLKKPTFIYIVI